MTTAQTLLALVPVAVAVVAIVTAALLEPWRARRARGARRQK